MKRIALTASILFLFLFFSCGEGFNIFEFNLFSGLDPVDIKTVADFNTSEEYGEYLIEQAGSETFIEELIQGGTSGAAIEALEGLYLPVDYATGTAAEVAQAQEAAVVAADIYLAESGGDDVVNNLFSVVTDQLENPGGIADPLALMGELLPATVPLDGSGLAAFQQVMLGLVDAAGAYSELAESLNQSATVSDNLVMGDVAQSAVVALLTANLLADIEASNAGVTSQAEAIESLYAALSGGAGVTVTLDVTELIDDASPNNDPAMVAVIEAAGIGSMFTGL